MAGNSVAETGRKRGMAEGTLRAWREFLAACADLAGPAGRLNSRSTRVPTEPAP